MNYDLSHLTQPDDQAVMGPIQDDEALLLYSICRVCCYSRVIEFGGLEGYSAMNFLKGMEPQNGVVYSVDHCEIGTMGDRHVHVHKDAGSVCAEDFENKPVDLVFFDCHDYGQQMLALDNLRRSGVITVHTLLVLHDTGIHSDKFVGHAVPCPTRSGWVHQQDERLMVRDLLSQGYSAISFGCSNPTPPIQYRHGLTFMRLIDDL